MDRLYFILGFVATVLTITASTRELLKSRRRGLAFLFAFTVLLSGITGYAFFRYQQATNQKLLRAEQKESARLEAAELLKHLPSSASYFSPGQARGIVYAGLAFFEQHQQLYPTTNRVIGATLLKDIEYAQAQSDTAAERHTMETAANSVIEALRGIAGNAVQQ